MPTKSLWTDRPDDWLSAPAETPATPPPATPPPRARRRRRRALPATALAVVVCAGAATGYAVGAGGDTPAQSTARLPASTGRLAPTDINTIYARRARPSSPCRRTAAPAPASSIDRDGTIVTNAHVVGSASRSSVRFDDERRPIDARASLGTDPSSDLAVARRRRERRRPACAPLPLADSDHVQVGDAAIAIGYPLGLDRTATAGIVSGLEREIEAPNGFRSTRSSRPTRRSTPATRAARCSTPSGA